MTQVIATELYYLRHVRSCAALASGKQCTCSGATLSFCIPGVLVVLGFIISMVMFLLQSTLLVLEAILSMFVEVLQKTLLILHFVLSLIAQMLELSPLEIASCIVVADSTEGECQGAEIALAVFCFFLAVCDWHVP